MRRVSLFNVMAIVFGIVLLYLPIAIMVIYSFRDSRSVTGLGGWSIRWYRELAGDTAILDGALISLRIALVSASAATLLGVLAALALFRSGRFRGRPTFASMIYAPLVMPEVVAGLSMLLLFVGMGADRGFWTVVIAHTTMAMGFAAIIVQLRLADFDLNLEEAAADLGAPPLRIFLTVTLPLIAPAMATAWMLALALSLNDLVIASFTTGPAVVTLPIRLFSEIHLGVKPEINAVCTLLTAIVSLLVLSASLLAKLPTGARRLGAAKI